MVNEIVVSFKGAEHTDPWLVVHADPNAIDAALDSITPDLVAKIHGHSALYQAGGALAQVAASSPSAALPVTSQQQAAAPTQAAWGTTPPPVDTSAGANVAAASPQPATGSILPASIKFWHAPDAKKPEYQAVYFTLPRIEDKDAGEAFRASLKKNAWAKWNGEQGEGSAWYANTNKEAWIKGHFAANAHLFA